MLLWLALSSTARGEKSASSSSDTSGPFSAIVRDLCAHLQIGDHVDVRIDETNSKMVSSEPLAGSPHRYLISFDRAFLESLDDDEIAAAIAHELGHIWIFSHHPYLQTEELANEIAMRVVDRETIKKVYAKLWAHTGVEGNLEDLLGPDPQRKEPKVSSNID